MPRNIPESNQFWASVDIECLLNNFYQNTSNPGQYRELADYIGHCLMDLGYRKD